MKICYHNVGVVCKHMFVYKYSESCRINEELPFLSVCIFFLKEKEFLEVLNVQETGKASVDPLLFLIDLIKG